MRKPLIGILPLVDTKKESYWMLPGYMNGIERAEGFPIMLPLTSDEKDIRQMAELCDGFLFTGGMMFLRCITERKDFRNVGDAV